MAVNKKDRIIMHIDCDSAFLSWTAVDMLAHGSTIDLRDIPSAVGGDELSRSGIILAKSGPAKKFQVKTGEPLFQARAKCKNLVVVRPDFSVYLRSSNAMVEILKEYTPVLQRYSIDECFLCFTNMENLYPDIYELAFTIKERIKKELGFTCSIGVSSNKLLAKMASELKKPFGITELYPNMIREKMWPLPVSDLFMVGSKTLPKLQNMGIYKIGDLANFDVELLKYKLKSHGGLIWKYANGIEESPVKPSNHINMKGLGNSSTSCFDIEDLETAKIFIMSLCETIGMRLRNGENQCSVIALHIRYSDFRGISRQTTIPSPTNITSQISEIAYSLFKNNWDGMPVRHIGVSVSQLSSTSVTQVSFFDEKNLEKKKAIDKTIDSIRYRFGNNSIQRSCFINSGIKPMQGGLCDSYPVMSSIL